MIIEDDIKRDPDALASEALAAAKAWQEAHYTEHPLTRLAALNPADEDEPALYVDQLFATAALKSRGPYIKPIKRGRGRPRKDDQNIYV